MITQGCHLPSTFVSSRLSNFTGCPSFSYARSNNPKAFITVLSTNETIMREHQRGPK